MAEPVVFNLRQLVQGVADVFVEKARKADLEFRISVSETLPTLLLTDPGRLRQILIHLIGNSIKFTPSGAVEVLFEGRETNGVLAQLFIAVRDTGVGLTSDQASRLFQPFSQGDASISRRYGGTGLGLDLSRRLARAMGGEVWLVQSSPDLGSEFAALLPALVGQQALDSSLESGDRELHSSLRGLRILLVEDTEDTRFLVQRFLEEAGARVCLACDGLEAIEAAIPGAHDLVLMDL